MHEPGEKCACGRAKRPKGAAITSTYNLKTHVGGGLSYIRQNKSCRFRSKRAFFRSLLERPKPRQSWPDPRGLAPKIMLTMMRVNARAAGIPTPISIRASFTPCHTTIFQMSPGSAPSAMRVRFRAFAAGLNATKLHRCRRPRGASRQD